jgi:hypothetical protein
MENKRRVRSKPERPLSILKEKTSPPGNRILLLCLLGLAMLALVLSVDWMRKGAAPKQPPAVIRGTAEPESADAHAPLHSAYQRFQQKVENHALAVVLFTTYYNCPHPQNASRYARDGRWRYGSSLGNQ